MPRPAPTDEQQAAIDSFTSGSDLVLEAGAGTGKTSTLLMLSQHAQDRGLYLAYNKAIQTEAGGKFPPHCEARTAHSLAYRAVGHRYRSRLNSDRVPLSRVAGFLGIHQVYVEGSKRLSTSTLARLSLEMVDRFCQSAAPKITARHRPFVEGIEDLDSLGELLLPFAQKAWTDLQSDKGGLLRFTHDYYLKMWQLSDPTLPCTFVLFDEAQDANPCIADIVARFDGQKVYVGDRAQSIYGWRGAVDAMDIPGVPVLFLSKSFRFGPVIAAEANRWLELLDTKLRLTGNEAMDSYIKDLDYDPSAFKWEERAILCRTNGTAFAELISAQQRGVKVHLQGGGQELLAFCRGAEELKSRGSSSHRDLSAFTTWLDVQEYVEEDKSAADLKVMVQLVDKYGTSKIEQAVQAMYPDEPTAELTVSTAHKAKGREWDSVRIAGDFEQRMNEAGDWVDLSREDIMLRYVAVTRAQYALDRGPLVGQPHKNAKED